MQFTVEQILLVDKGGESLPAAAPVYHLVSATDATEAILAFLAELEAHVIGPIEKLSGLRGFATARRHDEIFCLHARPASSSSADARRAQR